ncbi:MAG: hypothetical protein IH595_12855 [Bacteroidales bacterium]|nr:hypothetical protein [Bacteroidales bacterium]
MDTKLIVNLIVSGLDVFILARYIYLLRKNKIRPALATWTFFSLAVGISLFTYFSSGDGSYTIADNVLNFADFILVTGVSVAIFFLGDSTTRFNRFDLICLGGVGLIIIFWIVFNEPVITNFAVQAIMVLSYFPVVKRMLSQKENTEDFPVWIALMIAPLISLMANKGLLASVYAVRAIICTAALLLLMLRIEVMSRKRNRMEVNNAV